MTKGAKCFLGIGWACILHSGPNLPNGNTRISLEDPLPLFIVGKHPRVERGPCHVKLNDFEEFQSQHLSVAKQQPHSKNVKKKFKKIEGKGMEKMIQIMAQWWRCCQTPHKYYSRRNSTWPGGNHHRLQPYYSWHNPDTVLFEVPRPSVLYVVFYLTLK